MHWFLCLTGSSNYESVLKQKERLHYTSTTIHDVADGLLYKDIMAEDGFFRGTTSKSKEAELHITLQLNTDGVAIFKSSHYSVWPLYGVINELSPSSSFF